MSRKIEILDTPTKQRKRGYDMNGNIKWNHNMQEVPMDGARILISSDKSIWIAKKIDGNWYDDDGYTIEANLIAWSHINYPEKEDDQTKAYIVALEFAWDDWVDKQYLEQYDVSTMPQQYAAEIEDAIRRLVEHCLHKSRITRIVAPKKRLRYE